MQPTLMGGLACALLGAAEAWTQRDGWVGGEADGTWVYRTVEGVAGPDYTLRADFRIEKPTGRNGPTHQGTCFACCDYDAGLGGYEAAVVLRQNKDGAMYRLMLSSAWKEVLLWSPRGGLLQVRPFAFEPGRTYRLEATAAGARVSLSIDGQAVIDYDDRVAPVRQGGAALGRKEGAAWFRHATLEPAAAPKTPLAPPPARFSLRQWKDAQWGFDGDEPIFVLGPDANGYDVKLVPGYRAQLYVFWHWLNYGDEVFHCNTLKEATVQSQGDRLVFVVTAVDKDKRPDLVSRTTVTVSRDPARPVYHYDHVSELVVPPGATLRVTHPIEYTDPAFHEGVQSASTYGRQWGQPHPWSVYQHISGKLCKLPHNHAGWYPGYGTPEWRQAKAQYLKPDGGFWAMVGDPVANPVFQLQEDAKRSGEFYSELCGWGYDLHMRWTPGGKPGVVLQPGTYTVRWRMTSVDGKQGEAWLREAEILAPGDLKATWLLYTGGVGHVERFDKVVPQASPFGEYLWGPGTLQDTTVGRGDGRSLRLQGPTWAGSTAGGSAFTEPFDKDTEYEVSCWVKTEDVRGEGPGIHFSNSMYYPGITGTTDWRRIGLVARPTGRIYMEDFALRNSGSGTAWFDDFCIRPVTREQPAGADMARQARPPGAVGQAHADFCLIYTAASEVRDAAGTVLDLSGHGHHATLEGARWVDEAGVRVLEFDGERAYVEMRGYPGVDFGPAMTLSLWIKPGQNKDHWNMIATGGRVQFTDWSVFLFYKQSPYHLDIRIGGTRIFTDKGVIEKDRWSHLALAHDGQRMRVYVNGQLVKDEALAGRWHGTGDRAYLRLGAYIEYGRARNLFTGRMAHVKVGRRAWTPAEVAAELAVGPPAR